MFPTFFLNVSIYCMSNKADKTKTKSFLWVFVEYSFLVTKYYLYVKGVERGSFFLRQWQMKILAWLTACAKLMLLHQCYALTFSIIRKYAVQYSCFIYLFPFSRLSKIKFVCATLSEFKACDSVIARTYIVWNKVKVCRDWDKQFFIIYHCFDL